ncbi:MAG: hypothetical protein HDQ93_06875 [Desulfovibrio sp.]|nr:hypothetical protein [Desulfovibrio sp.]
MKVLFKKILSGVANLFVKKVTVIDPEGEEVTQTKPREGVKGIGWITAFLIVWHFILHPVLTYHFPDYSFPALDGGWISGLFLGL